MMVIFLEPFRDPRVFRVLYCGKAFADFIKGRVVGVGGGGGGKCTMGKSWSAGFV
jgi:hypothetical protein